MATVTFYRRLAKATENKVLRVANKHPMLNQSLVDELQKELGVRYHLVVWTTHLDVFPFSFMPKTKEKIRGELYARITNAREA